MVVSVSGASAGALGRLSLVQTRSGTPSSKILSEPISAHIGRSGAARVVVVWHSADSYKMCSVTVQGITECAKAELKHTIFCRSFCCRSCTMRL